MCVRACIKISTNSNVPGITQPIELKFGMKVEPKCLFKFLLKLIGEI